MSASKNITIDKKHLIACEGDDAYFFLIWFLDALKKKEAVFSEFQVVNFKGITELKKYVSMLSTLDNFAHVRSLTILRDAETDAKAACQSIRNSLGSAGYALPDGPCVTAKDQKCTYADLVTGFLLFPSCSASMEKGTLEDLCLRILKDENAPDLCQLAETTLDQCPYSFPRRHKNNLHLYFSLTDTYVGLKLGEAAKAQAFAWDRAEICSLKNFLLEMYRDGNALDNAPGSMDGAVSGDSAEKSV